MSEYTGPTRSHDYATVVALALTASRTLRELGSQAWVKTLTFHSGCAVVF